MSKEKIAFLFPTQHSNGDDKTPVLVMEAEEFPIITDLDFQVHFLGLEHGKAYWVSSSISRIENDIETCISGEKGVWIRAKGLPNSDNTLATSLSMHFENCLFATEGDYMIKTTLKRDNVEVHSAVAYFTVSDETHA